MISLMDKQKIIISYFLEGKSQWDTHRETGFDRKTIRKYIRQYEEKRKAILNSDGDKLILTEEIVSNPKYDASNRTKVKLTDEIIDRIDFFLEENKRKRETGNSKLQKKNVDIFDCLEEEKYDISYSSVCNYIKDILDKKKEAFIRQEYNLGEVLEFDWGSMNLTLNNSSKTVQMAVFTTAKGNFRFAYLYQNQKMESFLDSHVKFFNSIGGVHKTIVYDNMKVAVAKFVSINDKKPTDDLLKLSMYYGFRYRFCNIRRGNEKGHVEKSVEYVRRKAFSKKSSFTTLEEANNHLNETLKKLNNKPCTFYEGKSSSDILEEEKPYLLELMPSYDIAKTSELRVSKYSVITIDENKYSVPDTLVGKFVTTKIYPEKIFIFYNNSKIAEHVRNYGSHKWNIKIEHYLKTLKKKPGAIQMSTAMHQLSPRLQTIFNNYYTENPKDFIDLIELISENSLEKIEKIIKELEHISPLDINTEKVKMLCNRKHEEIFENKTKETEEIEEHSRLILSQYTSILNSGAVAFTNEVTIL